MWVCCCCCCFPFTPRVDRFTCCFFFFIFCLHFRLTCVHFIIKTKISLVFMLSCQLKCGIFSLYWKHFCWIWFLSPVYFLLYWNSKLAFRFDKYSWKIADFCNRVALQSPFYEWIAIATTNCVFFFILSFVSSFSCICMCVCDIPVYAILVFMFYTFICHTHKH